jgi:hypothetical protein
MITRSDIDTQTEGAKSMDSYHKSFPEQTLPAAEPKHGSRDVGGFSFGVIRCACCDFRMQHAVPSAGVYEELARPGEFVLTPDGRVVIIKQR